MTKPKPQPNLPTESVPITALHVDPDNRRRHPERNRKVIRASLQRFGQVRSLLARRDGRVYAGNGTLGEMIDLGFDRADVQWIPESWSDDDARAYALVDNRAAELAEWDAEALAGDIKELEAAGFTAADLGFTGKERRSLESRLKVDTDEDEIPDKPAKPTSRKGTLWKLGPHRLLCGDSRDPKHVARVLAGAPVDLIFTSPPYNVGINYRSHKDRGTANEYETLVDRVLAAWCPHLTDGRALIWNIGTSPQTAPGHHYAALERAGLDYLRTFVWAKVGVPIPLFHLTRTNPLARNLHANYTHELLLAFAKGGLAPGGPIVRDLETAYAHRLVLMFGKGPLVDGEPVTFGNALEHDLFALHQSLAGRETERAEATETDDPNAHTNLDTRKEKKHPAPFPVALPGAFIAHLADIDAIVADPFMGGGSTLIAAEQLGRRGVGIELDAGYVDVTVERWENLTGGAAKRG